jgi:serine protease AprX
VKGQTDEIIDPEIGDFEDLSRKDAGRMVVAFSLSLLIILASSITILYIWKGDDLVIERPSSALFSWEMEYKSLTGVSNQSLSGLNGNGVVLCVVDSGIDLSHPDLRDLVLKGWLDSVNGIDEPYDDEGHGTAMSGIIVADGGLKGISRGVDLLVAKAIDSEGQGDASSVANSVDWCVQQGADIISLSLGGGQSFGSGFFTTDELEQSVDEALDSGVFVIASAGNDGEDDDGDVGSPGSMEDVICVGGISRTGGIWSGSSEGDNDGRLWPNPILPRSNPDKKPEIVAPGHEVPVLMASGVGNSGWWGWSSGTSAATAWVSGSLALLLQDDPELQRENSSGRESIEGVKVAITQASQMMDGQDSHDDHYGYGHLRIDNLVTHFDDEG